MYTCMHCTAVCEMHIQHNTHIHDQASNGCVLTLAGTQPHTLTRGRCRAICACNYNAAPALYRWWAWSTLETCKSDLLSSKWNV